MLAAIPLGLTVTLLPLWTAGRDPVPRAILIVVTTLVAAVLVRHLARSNWRMVIGILPALSILWAHLWSGWSGFEGSVVWLWYFLLFALSYTLVDQSRDAVLGAAVLSLMIQCVWGWFIWISRAEPGALVFGTFYAANQFAGFIVLLSPLPLAIAMRTHQRVVRAGAVLLSAIAYASLSLSGSRGGIAAGIVGLLLLLVLVPKSWPILVVTILAAAMIATVAPLHPRFEVKTSGSTISNKVSSGSPVALRAHWMRSAIEFGLRAPLTGHGRDSFGPLLLEKDGNGERWSKFVHNDSLERFVEGGVPSLLFFTGFIAFVLVQGARLAFRLRAYWAIGVWAGLFSGAIHALVDHDWTEPGYAAAFMTMAGLLFGAQREPAP